MMTVQRDKAAKRKKTNVACINCSRSHVTCESQRPCTRCVKKGLELSCVNAPRKRRKYLADVPEDQLPIPLKPVDADAGVPGLSERDGAADGSGSKGPEHQFQDQGKIVHKPKFLSNAANLEYSTLSDIIHQDTLLNKIPVSLLYNGTDSPTPPSELSGTHSTSHGGDGTGARLSERPMQNVLNSMSSSRFVLRGLLGPQTESILNSNVDLFKVHFPLVPQAVADGTLDFKRHSHGSMTAKKMKYDKSINQYYLSPACALPEVPNLNKHLCNGTVSFSLESRAPDEHQVLYRSDWPHSLRYGTPMEIYTLISEPFCHTSGFHSLLKYLHSRFRRHDLVEMCRSIAEFRPIFIASAVDLTEEDMIFMEQSYQRTLLEYDRFITQIGTPTCVWRRNGQISYLNDEFCLLTGWTREELLSKMTFIVELLDDKSVREYFKTFSKVAYKDFKGFEQMETCVLLSPIQGRTIECSCMWTWKRDVFGMPMMIVGHFLPIIAHPELRDADRLADDFCIPTGEGNPI
ncbi:AaceriAFL031Wp [[Ashbya] aceris (nom. inval.)]|nr:AaceriAFL031Wp [[Ashbya] aceris (nom. inval.)]